MVNTILFDIMTSYNSLAIELHIKIYANSVRTQRYMINKNI